MCYVLIGDGFVFHAGFAPWIFFIEQEGRSHFSKFWNVG